MSPAIPRAGADAIEEVLEGYYRAYKPGDVIEDSEVSEEGDISEDTATRQKRFFHSLGLLEKDGHDYILTERAIEIGRLFEYDKNNRAYSELHEILLDWEPTSDLIEELDNRVVTEDELFDELEFVTDTPDADKSTRKEAGMRGLMEWYDRVSILNNSSGNWSIVENEDSPSSSSEIETDDESSEEEKQTLESADEDINADVTHEQAASSERNVTEEPAQAGSPLSVNLDIQMEVSEDSDPQKIETILTTIRQALAETQVGEEGEANSAYDADITEFNNG